MRVGDTAEHGFVLPGRLFKPTLTTQRGPYLRFALARSAHPLLFTILRYIRLPIVRFPYRSSVWVVGIAVMQNRARLTQPWSQLLKADKLDMKSTLTQPVLQSTLLVLWWNFECFM